MFREAAVPIVGMVENMSHFICPGCGDRVEVFERSAEAWAVREATGPLLGQIPLDIAIGCGPNTGAPIVVTAPHSPQVTAFTNDRPRGQSASRWSWVVARTLLYKELPADGH